MESHVTSYHLEDGTTVRFEAAAVEGFAPAGPGQIAGSVREAVEPAVRAAKEVLTGIRTIGPDEVQVTFGIKVSGDANWLVARAKSEANFEVTLHWHPAKTTDAR
ncbi:CU044_2847 family protein [Streptomonospora halophila]|uniref:CU044_2847 family protein n=1 Tax=Streptomonospora halophila TaxID=427369 RepID=UPI0031E6A359